MTAEDLESKLEQWKHKYLELLASEEKQTTYTQLLERSLGRLALVSEGINPALDKQLHSLRKELRSNKDVGRISDILEKIQQFINQMDESPQSSDASELLRHLLLSLTIPAESKPAVDNLLIQLTGATNQKTRELLPDFVTLLETINVNSPASPGPEKTVQGCCKKSGLRNVLLK